MNRVMVVLGIALLAAGLIVGFGVGVQSNGFDCRAAFTGSDLKDSLAEIQSQLGGGPGVSGCAEARSSAQVLPIVLLVIGAVVLVGAAFIPRRSEPATA